MNSLFLNLVISVFAASLISGATAGTTAAADDGAIDPPLEEYVSVESPPKFDQSSEAVDAFKATVIDGDFERLAQLLGLDAAQAKASNETTDNFSKIQVGVREGVRVDDRGNSKLIEIGKQRWPLPFPLVQTKDGQWSFDTYAGLQEIADRRVGENELSTIETVRATVDAQEEYASRDRDEDGLVEYAQKLISTEGNKDGLYWPLAEGDIDESPAGSGLLEGDALAGARAGMGYNGYRYRILTMQGDNVAGGKFDYIINGNMIAGFGLVAWPVKYGITGVKSFVVNKSGIVYEADLGADTNKVAANIRTFNPGSRWDVVAE